MEHQKLARYLMAAGGIAALGTGYAFLIAVPVGVRNAVAAHPELAVYYWPALIYIWIIGALCATALAEYFLICRRIGQNRSFCRENAAGLGRIARELLIAAPLCLASCGAPLLPGVEMGAWCAFPVLAAMASGALGILAWALGKLLNRAVQLKEENDLTI